MNNNDKYTFSDSTIKYCEGSDMWKLSIVKSEEGITFVPRIICKDKRDNNAIVLQTKEQLVSV